MPDRVSADFGGMDGRREPRFQIYAPGKLTVVDNPERELECLLLDISATGMKVVMDEGLPVDEVVALEVEDHLVLADVRYSEPRGDKFTIGAERIHAVDKDVLPQEKNRAEQIRFLVEDYRRRIRLAIAGEHSSGQETGAGIAGLAPGPSGGSGGPTADRALGQRLSRRDARWYTARRNLGACDRGACRRNERLSRL